MRRRFLSARRIDGGVAFWNDNADVLARAETRSACPRKSSSRSSASRPFYGRNTGSTARSTRSRRSPSIIRGAPHSSAASSRITCCWRATRRLAAHARRTRLPARWACRSSCPAATAALPSISTATAGSTCGRATADVVGSVANYLARHDWQRGQPVLLPALIAPEARDAAMRRLDGGISERRALELWAADGVTAAAVPDDSRRRAGRTSDARRSGRGSGRGELWIACHNFYVLTRYNRAASTPRPCGHLAQAIRAERGKPPR